MAEIRPEERLNVIEAVLRILDPDEVSDERVETFAVAASLYRAWVDAKRQL